MNQEVQELLLTIKLIVFVAKFDNFVPVSLLFRDMLIFYFKLYHINVTLMLSHVCRKDHSDDSLSEDFFLFNGKALCEVVLSLQEELHGFRGMVVLLNCLVVISKCSISHEVDMVGVVEAIVVKVVADSCSED